MAGQRFFPHNAGTGIPDIAELVADSAAAFKAGALVVVASDGELEECGTDPALVKGVALAAAGKGPGFNMADQPTVTPTYRDNKVEIVLATPTQIFVGRGVNGGTDPVTPTQTQVGESFGVIKDSDGIWAVDISDTSNTRVEIVKIDIDNKLYFFKFKTANIQL